MNKLLDNTPVEAVEIVVPRVYIKSYKPDSIYLGRGFSISYSGAI